MICSRCVKFLTLVPFAVPTDCVASLLRLLCQVVEHREQLAEARLRFVGAVKANYQNNFRKGWLSDSGLRVLQVGGNLDTYCCCSVVGAVGADSRKCSAVGVALLEHNSICRCTIAVVSASRRLGPARASGWNLIPTAAAQ